VIISLFLIIVTSSKMANVSDHTAQFENVAKVLSTMKSTDKKRNLLDHVQEVF